MASQAQQRTSAIASKQTFRRGWTVLPWSRWHVLVVVSLGVTWLLDGLESNLAGSLAGILKRPDTLGFHRCTARLKRNLLSCGFRHRCLGFRLPDGPLGPKEAFHHNNRPVPCGDGSHRFLLELLHFTLFRALTGAGIGGEYAAVNSAVDELIPARIRGHVDLLINSTFWGGAALGSVASFFLLNSHSHFAGVSAGDWHF